MKEKLELSLKHFANSLVYFIFMVTSVSRINTRSLVVDDIDQQGLAYQDYCPQIGACTEGSHVLCGNYDPQSRFSVECGNPENITMTYSLASYILQIINAMRAKVANGLERGIEKLPRAYGLIRMQWDKELATFAQIWADKCKTTKSKCQATKRFYNPVQILYHFKEMYPNWPPGGNTSELNEVKIFSYINKIFKMIYTQKTDLTVHNILKVEPRIPTIKDQYGMLVNQYVTHIGCGITGHSRIYQSGNPHLFRNVIFVCNLSTKPIPGKALYRTAVPDQHDSPKCGCPPGYKEDADCLCSENVILDMCSENNPKCKPTVVLLPIITFEDLPENNVSIARRFNGLSTHSPKVKSRMNPPTLEPSSHFDTSKKSIMKINIAPVKNLPGARGVLNTYLEKIRNFDETDDDTSLNPYTTVNTDFSNFIKKKQISTEERAQLLSALLDRVAQEINQTNLNYDAKSVIEDKIKKIYSSVIGEKNLLKIRLKGRFPSDLNDYNQYSFLPKHENIYNPFPSNMAKNIENLRSKTPNTNKIKSVAKSVYEINKVAADLGAQTKKNTYATVRDEADKNVYINIFNDEDELSDDRRKFYEDMLLQLKSKKEQQLVKSAKYRQDYIFERPVQRLRPLPHTIQQKYIPYKDAIYHGEVPDFKH